MIGFQTSEKSWNSTETYKETSAEQLSCEEYPSSFFLGISLHV
jgi:hypothetical protein